MCQYSAIGGALPRELYTDSYVRSWFHWKEHKDKLAMSVENAREEFMAQILCIYSCFLMSILWRPQYLYLLEVLGDTQGWSFLPKEGRTNALVSACECRKNVHMEKRNY